MATKIKTLAAATPVFNEYRAPFSSDERILAFSSAGSVVYGVNHPGRNSTKYAKFRQNVTGNRHFLLDSTKDTPYSLSGGAIATADLLRVVVLVGTVTFTLKKMARGDQAVPAGGAVVARGGGTAAGDATYTVSGANAAGATSVNLVSSGANTKTVLIGDAITIGTNTYYATAASTAFNGTTPVAFAITPPLQAALVGGEAITVAVASQKGIMLDTAPSLYGEVRVWAVAASDVVNVGGTLTAGQHYDVLAKDAMVASAATDIMPLIKG